MGSHKAILRVATLALSAAMLGCGGSPSGTTTFQYNFANGAQGWVGGSAEYPVSYEPDMRIETGIRNLPAPLNTASTGFYETGNNNSDDLFLYVKRQIGGLTPNTNYALNFRVTFATHALEIGGSSFYLKAGAAAIEPNRMVATVNNSPYYVMNVDKGNQANSGRDAITLGNLVKPTQSSSNWELKTLASTGAFVAHTDAQGSLWLLLGVDSGFEVRTELYYTTVSVQAIPK